MRDTGQILKESFSTDLYEGFLETYGDHEDTRSMAGVIRHVAGTVFEVFYQLGDAPYHDHDHTYEVCITGQTILKGMHIFKRVSPGEWLNYMIACLGHDIGYVFGIFEGDRALRQEYLQKDGNSTGASLTPIHVDRSKQFIRERFGHLTVLDMDGIVEMIEYTRFEGEAIKVNRDTAGFAGLVRAADLIGQMASPMYIKKMWHLYREFAETGALEKQPFDTVYAMRKFYPDFYNNVAEPLVRDAVALLERTMEGRGILASLYYNLYHTSNI